MKTLDLTFVKKEWHHEQVKRVGNVAIYKRWKEEGKYAASPAPHWEVIIVKSHNGFFITDAKTKEKVWIPPAETYPGETTWGTLGWSYDSLEKAETKFEEVYGLHH